MESFTLLLIYSKRLWGAIVLFETCIALFTTRSLVGVEKREIRTDLPRFLILFQCVNLFLYLLKNETRHLLLWVFHQSDLWFEHIKFRVVCIKRNRKMFCQCCGTGIS